ncbi:U-box domain-containing protein 62 [Andrographis paniculata]|uniref:U-box domain-containing protein 62 n=1 Tax=Andrographis paniculata TaxID=175694 RepID=UPI0021E7C7FF|nr:U-box domain-containing protein 62 [Andrographis paniculata]
MASDKLGAVPAPQLHAGLNQPPQLVFPDAFGCGPLRLSAAVADPGAKVTTRELTASFLGNRHYFQHQPQPAEFRHPWNTTSRSSGGDVSEADDEDDDDDDEVDDDEDKEEEEPNLASMVTVAKLSERNQNEEAYSTSQKMKHISLLGFKEGNVAQRLHERNSNSNSGEVMNARGGEIYYMQYLNGAEGPSSSSRQKEMTLENECGFSGKKESSYYCEPGDPLRTIFSDPISGLLMDDAMILPCGHSFGSGGIQQIIRTKTCYSCSHPVSEDSIAPNLSLRHAVQAFRREEELQINRSLKRRRERYDRDKNTYDSMFADHLRARGAQFPFSVTDRVIIKGNKRTPPRFVGREAIVTTQCLNGWYVVKTLDNAESVKLQYRSLAKVSENPSAKP